jgi:hypothetical protein
LLNVTGAVYELFGGRQSGRQKERIIQHVMDIHTVPSLIHIKK